MPDLDAVRLITALAHAVPGVVLDLHCCNGEVLTVAHRRPDAQLDPCELRAAVLASRRVGRPRLHETVLDVRVRGALEDLGGGLHRHRGPDGESRWFATLLDAEAAAEELSTLPVDDSEEGLRVALHPDAELGATVVCVTAPDEQAARRLDPVGFRALASCMVAETLQETLGRTGRR